MAGNSIAAWWNQEARPEGAMTGPQVSTRALRSDWQTLLAGPGSDHGGPDGYAWSDFLWSCPLRSSNEPDVVSTPVHPDCSAKRA